MSAKRPKKTRKNFRYEVIVRRYEEWADLPVETRVKITFVLVERVSPKAILVEVERAIERVDDEYEKTHRAQAS